MTFPGLAMQRYFKTMVFKLAAALLFFAVPGAAALTIEQVTSPQGMISARISPDGKHIAMIGFNGMSYGLFLIDTDSWDMKPIIHGKRVDEGTYSFNKQPTAISWVTNSLLAVTNGMYAESVDLTGKVVAEIGEAVIEKAELDKPDSPMVLVYTNTKNNEIGLANAKTGEIKKFRVPMSGELIHWAFDASGDLRAVTITDSSIWKDTTTVSNWYKPKNNTEWIKLADFKIAEDFWTPLSVPQEDNKLIISSSNGRNTRAVFLYDTQTRETGELLAGHPTQDILRVDGISQAAFTSVVTGGMKPGRYWFDPVWSKAQATADAALPNRINNLSGDPARRILIYSYSDLDPGRWYLLDMATLTLREVGQRPPKIDTTQMRPMEVISYKAHDGLTIPAYLTRPAGSKGPGPAVIMIHGGPTYRDSWGWDADVQLLAASGYVVLQPQFRGSTGFGKQFQEAGSGQWGLAMQDDITAGVEHLIQNGIVDPKRICIYGASYGGYAALWGLVKTPELYRCAISFAGVSDIASMFDDWSDSNGDKISRELMRARIGDVRQSKEQFEAVSPLLHADKIRAPVLLMHGDDDVRVPISHSKKMMKALDKYQKPYEWVEFVNVGHGLFFIQDKQRFYRKMLAFLNKYIGDASSAAAQSGASPAAGQ